MKDEILQKKINAYLNVNDNPKASEEEICMNLATGLFISSFGSKSLNLAAVESIIECQDLVPGIATYTICNMLAHALATAAMFSLATGDKEAGEILRDVCKKLTRLKAHYNKGNEEE